MAYTLFLDVDGVLVNGRPSDGRNWASEIERDMGIDPNLLNRHFFAKHWAKIVTGQLELRGALQDCLAQIAPNLSADDLIAYWFDSDSRIDQQVLAQVDLLRHSGVSVFLATNQEHLRASYLMQKLGLMRHVDGIIYSAAVSAKKPEREFFAECERAACCAPSEAVLVDDTLCNIEAALQAGWRTFRWTGTGSLTDLFHKSPVLVPELELMFEKLVKETSMRD